MKRAGVVVGLFLVLGACDPGYEIIGDDEPADGASSGATEDEEGDDSAEEGADASEGSNDEGGRHDGSGGDETGGDAGDEGSNDEGSNDDGSNDDGDGTTGDEPGGSEGEDATVFAQEIVPILQARCGCHASGSPSAGLDLRPDAAYDSLVGVPSSSSLPYVTPGSAEDSYLVHKMLGTQLEVVGGGGGRMPPGAGVIPEGEIDAVIAWIDDGAM